MDIETAQKMITTHLKHGLSRLVHGVQLTPAEQAQKKILALIQSHRTIVCLRHKDPDPDAIGSQHGLAAAIKAAYPDKLVYCLGENSQDLSWLGKSDEVVPPADSLIIVTDCPDVKRISGLDGIPKPRTVVKIDHHPLADQFADVAWIDDQRSSASEMVCDLIAESSQLKLTKRAAACLYAGIIGDTGRFMFPGVSAHTFNVVARLARTGIDLNRVNREESLTTINATHLYGYLDQHLQFTGDGVAYYVLTKSLMDKFHITPDTFISKNLPGNIRGVVAWAMFTEDGDTLKISLRSHAPAINKLAAKYNGGGHALASGARIYHNADTKANVKRVVRDLQDVVDHYAGQKNFQKLDK